MKQVNSLEEFEIVLRNGKACRFDINKFLPLLLIDKMYNMSLSHEEVVSILSGRFLPPNRYEGFRTLLKEMYDDLGIKAVENLVKELIPRRKARLPLKDFKIQSKALEVFHSKIMRELDSDGYNNLLKILGATDLLGVEKYFEYLPQSPIRNRVLHSIARYRELNKEKWKVEFIRPNPDTAKIESEIHRNKTDIVSATHTPPIDTNKTGVFVTYNGEELITRIHDELQPISKLGNVEGIGPKCTCGAKHTTFPNHHLTHCKARKWS